MDIYIDESIHERANFIVLAAVCAGQDDIRLASEALSQCGFVPGRDEFKSSMTMSGNKHAQDLRERFREIIGGCKIAIGVCAVNERHQLMALAARISEAVSSHDPAKKRTVHLDQGMKRQPITLPNGYLLNADCDSKAVIGIQVADCCAHFIATMLLGELGLFTKMVPARRVYPENEGDLELAWELWASIRYALAGSEPIGPVDDDGDYEPLLKPFGLVLSDGCDERVVEVAEKRFGSVWVGCIH
ncbi:DUF3800 domain-containing protein [Rhizobium ruizarguesonis]|uniref:DUF3800 domain-containing protein n=1 Tax=Rhizobium ruizarguesonis TaxID=2081791 RepID=UPI00102FCBA0|nr:DUF3800 domain-containing protein [Rhizobium ruizarguesonis]TBE18866.1 hypothetical protein ELH05_31460 [Rhizobium ruizarguesonis]WSH25283.1 DUF3800 domain-containing protein [Rhizobium ruizarguesonis]WSH37622.1 DUF3800 domain-containing protein [Rhizobium ruizarguesonis]